MLLLLMLALIMVAVLISLANAGPNQLPPLVNSATEHAGTIYTGAEDGTAHAGNADTVYAGT